MDSHQPQRVPPEVAGLLTSIKEGEPRLTVKAVIRQARDSGRLQQRQRLAHSTVNRLLKQAGLMKRPANHRAGGDLRRYQRSETDALWQTDVMHGPKIAAAVAGRRQTKVCLLPVLDEATRVVPHSAGRELDSCQGFSSGGTLSKPLPQSAEDRRQDDTPT